MSIFFAMRSFGLLIVLILIFGEIEPANAQQAQFDYANELMQDQRIEEALDTYRIIENNGYLSGKLYYNMAIAALYQDSLGVAKYYLLQSVKYPDVHSDASEALQYVEQQFNRRSAVLPKLPWERFFEWLEENFGATALILLGLFLFNISAGGIIGSWFADKGSILLKRAGYAAGILSILLISFSFYLQYVDSRFGTAVMTDRQTIVHENPLSSSALISSAYEGYTMRVDHKRSEQNENWYYVRLQNGMYGWIEREKVRIF